MRAAFQLATFLVTRFEIYAVRMVPAPDVLDADPNLSKFLLFVNPHVECETTGDLTRSRLPISRRGARESASHAGKAPPQSPMEVRTYDPSQL